jgi:hypothetical protein
MWNLVARLVWMEFEGLMYVFGNQYITAVIKMNLTIISITVGLQI